MIINSDHGKIQSSRSADKNIPFVFEKHNGIDWIVYEKADIDSFCKIEADIGIQQISSDPTI